MSTSIIPSTYQLGVKQWLVAGKGNGIVEACPGSGKTFTLVWLTQFIPLGVRVAFLSFGKDIVATLRAKCPNAFCKTFGALGFAPIRQRLAGKWIKLHDGKKVPDKSMCILWDMFPKDSNGDRPKEYFMYSRFVVRLVSLAKNVGIGTSLAPNTGDEWRKLIAYHGLTLDSKAANEERAIEIAQDVLRISNEWSLQGKIDFNDQLYLVALWDLNLEAFDLVFVDEWQDTNAIQIAMLQKLAKANGSTRYLLVGDQKQSIYGFRGADTQAMKRGSELFNAQSLKLSICYRCSKSIVDSANEIFPEVGMEAAPNAPLGKVASLDSYNAETFNATDAILCRNVAPLVKLAYSFILKRVACHILGREIGTGLNKLVDRMDASDVSDLQSKLDEYRTRETSRLMEKNKSGEAESINDQCDCLALFISNLKESNRTIDALKQSIASLFENRDNCLTLCTIHKSKGLEWQRVFILDYGLIPSKYAKQEWQLDQEKNLQWVANTRPRLEKYFIESGCWSDTEQDSITPNETEDKWDTEEMLA